MLLFIQSLAYLEEIIGNLAYSPVSLDEALILVTHRLASVRMADRILVLKQQRLIEQGTHEDLTRQGSEYASLWKMQAEQYQV